MSEGRNRGRPLRPLDEVLRVQPEGTGEAAGAAMCVQDIRALPLPSKVGDRGAGDEVM